MKAAVLALAIGLFPAVAAAQNASGQNTVPATGGDITITPFQHASLQIEHGGKVIQVDPAQGDLSKAKPGDLVLITDIHGDHLNTETLSAVASDKTTIIAPSTVAEKLPENLRKQTTVLANGETKSLHEIKIEAVPMYNLTQERLKFHNKGRGNGYVLTLGGKRVYISGDTEDIPEMRALKNIDVAFVCMNLPYTMDVNQAASAVREFRPRIVYPYHYRGSDVEKFKSLVGNDRDVEVRLRDWYQAKP